MNLPRDILWKIWTFVGPKSYFIDKLLINIITTKKQIFIDNPLEIHYKLCRWKKRHHHLFSNNPYSRRTRETIYVESPKSIKLSGNCSIGKVNKNKILQISQQLSDKLIPLSTMRESSNGFKLTVFYWTIESIWCLDERVKLYSRLWPSWKLIDLETF